MQIRNLSRAEYDTHKAAFIAKLRAQMESLNTTVAAVATLSRTRVIEGKTDTAVTNTNIYHYLSGVSMPTPKKLGELAFVLDLSPTDLMPTFLQGRRHVKKKAFDSINGSTNNGYKVTVEPGHGLEVSKLLVEALMPTHMAYTWAKVISDKLNKQQMAHDHGTTEQEFDEHNAAARRFNEVNK
jgi:hypothetical protein